MQQATLNDFIDDESEIIRRREKFLQSRLKGALGQAKRNEYHLGIGDTVEVSVFDLPELDSTVQVAPDGSIALPIINEVNAKGLTAKQLQNTIASRLKPYVINPRVRVAIPDHAANKVSVIGAVERAGVYPLTQDRITILEVLSAAGGRTEKAGSRIVLIPTEAQEGSPVSTADSAFHSAGLEFFIDDVTSSGNESAMLVPLRNGDVLFVPEAGSFQIDGDVEEPGTYALTKKMSVLGAVAAAGGLRYSADVSEVEVIRDFGPGEKKTVVFDLEKLALNTQNDFRLRDGDVVRVPSASGRFFGAQTVEFINGLVNVGYSGGN